MSDIFNRKDSNSLWNQGVKDSFYRRRPDPHFMKENASGQLVREKVEHELEVNEYLSGYDWNERHGDFKSFY